MQRRQKGMKYAIDAAELSLGTLARLLALHQTIIMRKAFHPNPADWCRAWFESFIELNGVVPLWPSHADDEQLGLSKGTLDEGAWELVGANEAKEFPGGGFVVLQEMKLVH